MFLFGSLIGTFHVWPSICSMSSYSVISLPVAEIPVSSYLMHFVLALLCVFLHAPIFVNFLFLSMSGLATHLFHSLGIL